MKLSLRPDELNKIQSIINKVDSESSVTDIVLEKDEGGGIGYTLDLYLTTRFLGDVVDIKYEITGVENW